MADFVKGFQEATKKENDPAYVAYLAGTQIAQMAKQRILPSMKGEFEGSDVAISEEIFHRGFVASLAGDNSVYTDSAAQAYFEAKSRAVKEAMNAAYKAENAQWIAENGKKEGVVTLPSGLQYKVITMGEGEKPRNSAATKSSKAGPRPCS